MHRREIDSKVERQLLVHLICCKGFLAQACTVFDVNLIEEDHFRQVAEWCIDYYNKYKDAPGKAIESIFYGWADGQEDQDLVDDIHDFLEHLSENYEEFSNANTPFLLDLLGEYVRSRKLTRLKDRIEYFTSSGDTKDAELAVTEYSLVQVGQGAGIDPFNDEGVWDRAFSEQAESLMSFPGPAANFLGRPMTRDALIGIQGPEKRGKTMWCVEFVMRSLRARRKVALFEVGDMSESQIMQRFGVRLSGRPLYLNGAVRIPKSLTVDREEDEIEVDVNYHTENPSVEATAMSCKKAADSFMRGCGFNPGRPFLRVSVHSNSSINVKGIDAVLEQWRVHYDFIADVIIIDYADILAPEDPSKQMRDQVNETWKALRRLSQDRHALVITPTQADAESYDVHTQRMRNFSEDKRKYSHVTGMLGLNQTPEEKTQQIMRLNWLVGRGFDYSPSNCIYVGQCFALSRALCCSAF